MTFSFENKVALVTGAASGSGLATPPDQKHYHGRGTAPRSHGLLNLTTAFDDLIEGGIMQASGARGPAVHKLTRGIHPPKEQ
jgi:hypothetical protein